MNINPTFILQVILWVIAGAFGLLTTVAALGEIRKKVQRNFAPFTLMSVGGVGLLGAVVDGVSGGAYDWLLALIACGMVCAGAVWNGRSRGDFHLSHHVVRMGLSLVLVAGFALL